MRTLDLWNSLVVVRGGGDIASGIIHRLFTAGFPVVLLEIERPTHIRRTVSFAQAVFDGAITIEGLTAVKTENTGQVYKILEEGKIPVLIDEHAESLGALKPAALVDAILAKTNLGTDKTMAGAVIGIGPGFTAGIDTDAVVETNRGHFLGKVIWNGSAQADTGIPGTVNGISSERVVRSPGNGDVLPLADIGTSVQKGDALAAVGNKTVTARISGIVRGMINKGIHVTEGYKIGDIDPRNDPSYCYNISDKSRAVGGGVLEALIKLLSSIDD